MVIHKHNINGVLCKDCTARTLNLTLTLTHYFDTSYFRRFNVTHM